MSKKDKETLFGVAFVAFIILAIVAWRYAASVLALTGLAGFVWCIVVGREKGRTNKKSLYFLSVLPAIFSLIFLSISMDAFKEYAAAEDAERIKSEHEAAAEKAAHQADLDRVAAEAKEMGLSVTDYNRVQKSLLDARADCVHYLKSQAKYDAKLTSDSQAGWTSNGTVIVLQGRDVMLQNGFGAWTRPEYRCVWNISMRKVLEFKVKTND